MTINLPEPNEVLELAKKLTPINQVYHKDIDHITLLQTLHAVSILVKEKNKDCEIKYTETQF